ncbi:hypothetical protein ACQW02_27355 [Humitalea sp. 24SJ18S-53]|uniref:hypothetical protein n=1 Tax=Humitalea sp. 24SJ18S-53 TaxID=3422307 RepID=UPI003D666393
MGILLAFAPFLAFAVVDVLAGAVPGLLAGAAIAFALLVRDWIDPKRSPKLMEIGAAVLFTALALYALLSGAGMSLVGAKFWVDLGLLAIALLSMVIGRPFTLQYARESVPSAYWNNPEFLRTNQVITAAWALAFAVIVSMNLVMLYVPGVPRQLPIVVTILSVVAAAKFTTAYSERAAARP